MRLGLFYNDLAIPFLFLIVTGRYFRSGSGNIWKNDSRKAVTDTGFLVK
jgi:hypothetical protein